MSKIAEQKALEIVKQYDYPWDTGSIFKGYIIGYDQAMQDFLEKAERYLKNTLYDRVEIEVYGTLIPSITNKKAFIEDFKNYMQNESEK